MRKKSLINYYVAHSTDVWTLIIIENYNLQSQKNKHVHWSNLWNGHQLLFFVSQIDDFVHELRLKFNLKIENSQWIGRSFNEHWNMSNAALSILLHFNDKISQESNEIGDPNWCDLFAGLAFRFGCLWSKDIDSPINNDLIIRQTF